jgi:hypothetical protein
LKTSEARYYAYLRAIGALNAYLDGGAISEKYGDLPEADVIKIEKEFQHIIESLRKQFDRVPPPKEKNT